MKKKSPKIVGIVIGLIVSLGVLYLGFSLTQGVFTRANDERPQEVTISEITDTSATVSWTTQSDTENGVVQYGVTPGSLTSFAPSEDGKGKKHSIELTLLAPVTTYYFEIFYSENSKFNNSGAPWTFITKDRDSTQTQSSTVPSPTPKSTVTSTPVTACSETTCEAILKKLGNGCSTQEYVRCLKKGSTTSESTSGATIIGE